MRNGCVEEREDEEKEGETRGEKDDRRTKRDQ